MKTYCVTYTLDKVQMLKTTIQAPSYTKAYIQVSVTTPDECEIIEIKEVMPMTPERLFEENYNLVYFIYHKHFQEYTNYQEDLLQEGSMGLWQACRNFDESRNIQFCTYASVAIQRHMTCYVHRFILKNKDCVSLDEEIANNGEGDSICLMDTLSEDNDDSLKYIIQACMEQLSPRDLSIINLISQGYTQNEIASRLHLSQPSISRCVTRFKKLYEKEKRNVN